MKSKNSRQPEVAVVIVSYNTAKLTQQAIDAVLASKNVRLSMYVVDNASSDRTLTQLRRKYGVRSSKSTWIDWQERLHDKQVQQIYPNVKVDVTAVDQILTAQVDDHALYVLTSQRNLGFGRANNLAAGWTSADYIFFLNSDAFVQPNTVHQLTKAFRKKRLQTTSVLARMQQRLDNVGIVAAELRNEDGSVQRQGGSIPNAANVFRWITFLDDVPILDRLASYQHHDHDMQRLRRRQVAKVGWVGGTAMMVARECIEEIGGFDGDIFMYGEDVELCWRATKRHWDVAISSKAVATHLGSASSNKKTAILGEISGLLYMWKKHRSNFDIWLLRRILMFGLRLRILIFGILRRYGKQRVYQEALELVRQ